tara:strand:+ start:329 stop:613 length:285 start_codon:yes stop_codon:yes gene_type:complete
MVLAVAVVLEQLVPMHLELLMAVMVVMVLLHPLLVHLFIMQVEAGHAVIILAVMQVMEAVVMANKAVLLIQVVAVVGVVMEEQLMLVVVQVSSL